MKDKNKQLQEKLVDDVINPPIKGPNDSPV